jgi:2-aminoadipate transaminase
MLRYRGQDIPRVWFEAPERVLLLSSVSKLIAPGVRVGYTVAPPEQAAVLAKWAIETYIGPVLLTEAVVHEYCSRGLLERNVERLKEVYRPRLQATFSALERHLPQASWTRTEGGFFVGVNLPEGVEMTSLLARAEQVGLRLSDGRGFFPNPSDGNRFLRIPFSSVTPEQINEGIRRLSLLVGPG